ncbi:MAG: hypothetical protein A4E56_00421 [Pelotomaculum sp. PtaU1.Bin065]|nr:MAG: hypothetical protein A4E56_00421 [Pelotomaculum sp. PtaU1.Bin065]
MKRFILILCLIMLPSYSVAFAADGIPINYVVNIPYVYGSYPPYTLEWKDIWSYTVPSGQRIVAVNALVENVNNDDSIYARLVVDGVEVDNKVCGSNKTINLDYYGPCSQILLQQRARTSGERGAGGLPNGGTLTIETYVASGADIVEAKNAAISAAISANTASVNAVSAYNAAISANTNAINAYNMANSANTYAQQAATNSSNAYNIAYNTYQVIITDKTPPTIQKLQGLNGATCTTSSSFHVSVTAIDNTSENLYAQAKIDDEGWGGWYDLPRQSLPIALGSIGPHTITVRVKDSSGNMSTASMTAFRI